VSALDLLQGLSQAVWVLLSVLTTIRAIRRPSRASLDIALFFGSLAIVLVYSRLTALLGLPPQPRVGFVALLFLLTTPYLLLRLVHDFGGVRGWIRRAAEAGFIASAVVSIPLVFNDPVPPGTPADPVRLAETLFIVGYFALVAIYAAARAAQLAFASQGMTRQRLRAVATGSYLLGITLLLSGVGAAAPSIAGLTSGLSQLCFLASGLSYGVGFAPPNALRRYWQLPELRAFLARSATIPRSSMAEIIEDLAGVVGRALGARATIGLWDDTAGVLRFGDPKGALPPEVGPSGFIVWRSFASQRPLYVSNVAQAHPENAAGYEKAGVGPILAAPITAGTHRIGVLEVFASREPLFAEDDLEFVLLMAQQAAVVLESRALIDDAARVRAQEETARLKEDFVSAAAHDLKTPLTTIVAQAQLLEMRAEREGRQAELDGIRRLMRETGQLSRLVEQILDASRIERGSFPVHLEDCDLAQLASEVVARDRAGSRRLAIVAEPPVRGRFDPDRIRQLLDNLIDNALKYSPEASPVTIRAWTDGDARLSVTDAGIGIPPEDIPHVFERFRRGSNVDHRRFGGIGLGLFICHGIVEQHQGRIWVQSVPGRETTFQVALPLVPVGEPAPDATTPHEVTSA
jgi:signal transduction histidine kinase